MPLFASLSARRPPRQLSPYRRGMRSCRYMPHFRHLALSHAIHGLPRAPNPACIYYTFCASAPDATFPVKQGYAILSIFATLAAPGLLTRHPRIPAGTRSCAYLLHILHVGPRRNFSRRTKVCDLAAICDTCGTWPSHTPLTDSRGHPILCIFTTHSTLPLGASPSSNFAPFESYAYLLHFPSAKALGSVWG